MEAAEVMELVEVLSLLVRLIDTDGDNVPDNNYPSEILDLVSTLSDGEQGNNDIETILLENLVYDDNLTDDKTSALSEVSQRLEVIDTRLDTEFTVLNYGLSVIMTVGVVTLSIKFFGWLSRLMSC